MGQPKPAAADPDGTFYTFERGVQKTDGKKGWADVWLRGHFGWEYKGKHKDLKRAYQQLLLYREDLENPPILVVCDMERFEIHTNFTGTAKRTYCFGLEELAEPEHFDTLRKVFSDPETLRPGLTTETVTQTAAEGIQGQLRRKPGETSGRWAGVRRGAFTSLTRRASKSSVPDARGQSYAT